MKDCEMIKEMLPLYIDGVCKDEVKDSIEKHLNECPECKALYEDMIAEMPLANPVVVESIDPFKKIDRLHKKKTAVLICTTVFALLLIVGALVYYFIFEKGVNIYCQKEPAVLFATVFDTLKAETNGDNFEIIVDTKNGAMLYGDNVNFNVAGINTLKQFVVSGSFEKTSDIAKLKIKPLLKKIGTSYGVSLKKTEEVLGYVADKNKIKLGEYSVNLLKAINLETDYYDAIFTLNSEMPISSEKFEEIKQSAADIDAYAINITKPLITIKDGMLNEFKNEMEVIKVLIIKYAE